MGVQEALLLSDMTSEARCAAVMGKSLLPKRHPLRIPLKAVTVVSGFPFLDLHSWR